MVKEEKTLADKAAPKMKKANGSKRVSGDSVEFVQVKISLGVISICWQRTTHKKPVIPPKRYNKARGTSLPER